VELLAKPEVPSEQGEFQYDVRTSYFPHIKGHYPAIYRLEAHESGFVAVPLSARVGGKQRPTVKGRFPAKNGEVFKIVRENGEYSYQVPFEGTLYNLKQYGDLSRLGVTALEHLRRFLERVEPEVFETLISNAQSRLENCTESLEKTRDQLQRWRVGEFWSDEAPASKRELREMLQEAKEDIEQLPTSIAEGAAVVEWLKGIDRSSPNLQSVPPVPAPQRRLKLR
jgi:hypothetical protein